ncbi:MAG: hypothetical protein K2G35_06795 [Duncaniella sp.]|nr:hypothetical protein [Duncaniella sp.]
MTHSFVLFHAETVNECQNAVCHLILIPVTDGVPQTPQEFFFNPEAPFLAVMSGITASQVASFPTFASEWPKVQAILSQFDMAVCSAEGYSARALYNTLSRLGVSFEPIRYCNAKSICRRTLDEVSYSLDYLSYALYGDTINVDDPIKIAQRWCDLALKGLDTSSEASIPEFLAAVKIQPGEIAEGSFIPSCCKRDYSKRQYHRPEFDASAVEVDADPENPFYAMNVVFTGKMESMTRNDARAAVVKVGGLAPERLTQETDYLVVGIQDLRVVGEKGLSGKMKTAAKYREKGMPIEIIDEQDFIDMLGEKNFPVKQPKPTKPNRTTPFITADDIAGMTDEEIRKIDDAFAELRKSFGLE